MSPMKSIVSATALVFNLIWPAAHSTMALAQAQPAPAGAPANSSANPWGSPNPQIDIAYIEPKDARFQPIFDKLKKRQVLEELQAFLAPLKLPRKLTVRTDQCGAAGVHYKPGGPVTLCYEYVAVLEQAAPDVKLQIGGRAFGKEDAVVGSFVHLALHEVARASFDVLAIPVWGREEHAADRVAGFLMFQFGEKVAYRTLVGTSWFLSQVSTERTGLPTGDFSYTRGLDGETLQRFYNMVCIALGGDGVKYDFLKKSLPKDRADNCRWEYLQLARSFNDTFMPHVDQDLMKKVQATDWLDQPGAK
jgi:Putative metallopeptidase